MFGLRFGLTFFVTAQPALKILFPLKEVKSDSKIIISLYHSKSFEYLCYTTSFCTQNSVCYRQVVVVKRSFMHTQLNPIWDLKIAVVIDRWLLLGGGRFDNTMCKN